MALLFLSFLLLMNYPTAGSSRSPLIVLDQHEGSGIRLICRSDVLTSPELLQLSWMDIKGKELPASATTLSKTSIANSILLEPGSGNAVSCRISSNSSNTLIGSTSLVIADIFFPSISLLMVGFFVIAALSIGLIAATIYKVKNNRLKIALAENEQRALEEEKAQLQRELEKQKRVSQEALKELQENFAKAKAELEFRRALSNAVNVTLDPKCTHTKLNIREKNKVKVEHSPSGQKDLKGALIAVAHEGYSSGENYWEVEMGNKPDWELGVLTEETRRKLEMEKLEKPLEEGYVGMRWFQGQYHCTGGDSLIDSLNEESLVVGVFLDMKEHTLSFYNVQKMCAIRSIPVEFNEKMYPFFNPGKDDRWLGVRPVSFPPYLGSL